MKRILVLLAAAAAACASSPQRMPSDTAATAATPDQTGVVQPSSLSPEQVRLVQRSLADRGFAVDMSGRFDATTQQALTEFQRTRGLPATGNLNPPTVDALGLDPRDVMPVRGEQQQGSTRDPNPEGSPRHATTPSQSSSGMGTNTGGPTSPDTASPPSQSHQGSTR